MQQDLIPVRQLDHLFDGRGQEPDLRLEQLTGESLELTAPDDGVGLGLSIVAAIAAAHGGTAHVEDTEPPPGATFVLTLPRNRKDPTWRES